MHTCKVSVITPCYNSEKLISQTIESVLAQEYKNIEYIIVDGGSTDHTVEIIKKYVPLFRGRLTYISEKDKGIYDAMNKGIRMSHGELIGIINSDDYYEKDTIKRVLQEYMPEKKQVIYGYCRVIERERGIKINRSSHRELHIGMIPHATCFLSRKIYQENGLFLQSLQCAADYELMLRLSKAGDVTFIQIPEILANFRAGGLSSTKISTIEKNLVQLKYHHVSVKKCVGNIKAAIF